MRLFHYFLHFTNPFFPPLLYLVRSPILCHQTRRTQRFSIPSPTSFPTLLLFTHTAPICSKTPFYTIPYLLQFVAQRYSLYLSCLVVPESYSVVSSSFRLVCNRLELLELPLLIAFPCVDSVSPSFLSSCSLGSIPSRIRSSRYVSYQERNAKWDNRSSQVLCLTSSPVSVRV